MKTENNIHKPKTKEEAIDNLLEFLEYDLWHCFEDKEFKNEDDMIRYLRIHFKILREEIKELDYETSFTANKNEN